MPDFKRKKLNMGVKKYFQRWLLKRILGAVVLSSLVAALILYFYARNEITSSFFDAHIKIRRVSDLLLPVVAAGSMVSLISGIVLSLFLPQKIAGPIFRIEQDLKPIQEGDLTKLVQLRDGDILSELAEEVNKTTLETRNRIRKSKKALSSLSRAIEDHAEERTVQTCLKELEESLSQLKTQ